MRDRRFGLTLLEWLVVIVCVLIVLGLLIPAIEHESPHHRNQCSTQLKNFALAAMQYENTKGSFPGYVQDFGTWVRGDPPRDITNPNADPDSLRTHRKIGTWAVALLPWLDAQPTYEQWTQDRYSIAFGGSKEMPLSSGAAGDGFSALAAANLAIFQCPKDPTLKGVYGRNSYIFNSGMYHRGPSGADVWQLERETETITIDFARSMSAANGVANNQVASVGSDGELVAIGPKITLDDFHDGQGHTMLFSESLQAMPWHRAGFIDADDLVVTEGQPEIRFEETSRYTQGMVWHFEDDSGSAGAQRVNPIHRINGAPTGVALESLRMTRANAADLARPSSAHVEGVNAGMADGSTRYLRETIDYRVYQSLLTPWGEQSDVPDPGFVIDDDALQ